ncbi:GbsR/MarR family transcriptional regulator [Amycolatopsis dongchuanensis]|uniref:Helix-turn-helix domain-containing protein n=1 Tax=Amycolatopsis dongchuanensis TaxID=1070866 RepID=A0ABP9PZ17_9PSEU
MPGGRLTREDRERIARWLGEGLGYAEIARRLGRPTSTISREVARNGGPGNYQAEGAHQATTRRAQRRPSASPPSGAHAGAVRDFEDEFTEMMVATGLPPMAARVLACLYTADTGSFTAAELVRRLRVSPASVSKAVGYLEKRELVRRERDGQHRRERYVIDDDVWYRAWAASTRSIGLWADASQRGAEILGEDSPAGARLRRTSRFFRLLGEDMARAAERRMRSS